LIRKEVLEMIEKADKGTFILAPKSDISVDQISKKFKQQGKIVSRQTLDNSFKSLTERGEIRSRSGRKQTYILK
jgi:hypothetical protein